LSESGYVFGISHTNTRAQQDLILGPTDYEDHHCLY